MDHTPEIINGVDVQVGAQMLIEETEEWLRYAAAPDRPMTMTLRSAVPVSPGVPNAVRIMVQYWTGKDPYLVQTICSAYQVSEHTARLWIHTVRNAGQ